MQKLGFSTQAWQPVQRLQLQVADVRRHPAASNLDRSPNAIFNEIMAELTPSPPRSDTKPWLNYVGRSMLAFVLLSMCLLTASVIILALKIAPLIAPWFGGVPKISGTLVDAVTGQSVPGMDVCLVGLARDSTGVGVDRSEVTHSDASGKFSFAPSVQKGFGARGYQIGITDPAAQLSFTCGKYRDLLTNPG